MKRLLLWVVMAAAFFAAGLWFQKSYLSAAEADDLAARNGVLVKNESIDEATGNRGASPTLPDGLMAEEEHNILLFEQAAPSVCFITTTTLQRSYYSRNVQEIPSGTGSGFIWDQNGHIVTNFHVIQNANKAQVTLSDGKSYEATVVGYAAEKDLAVLKIDAPKSRLKPIPVGVSRDLRVGQNVYAIGNPFGLDQTLTTGVVSALGREINSVAGIPIRDVIQSDAAINPGNSGGPLLNSSGKLIGVNTAIYSPSGASAGIGFSIPVDVVKWVVPDLINFGKVNRPVIGVELAQPQRNIQGAIVLSVEKNSPAERAGIQPVTVDKDQYGRSFARIGDVITAVNNNPVASNSDLYLAFEQYKAGDEVTVTVDRNGKEINLKLRLVSSADL